MHENEREVKIIYLRV